MDHLELVSRKTAKKLAYRSRYKAITSAEQVLRRKLKKVIYILLIKQKIEGTNDDLELVTKLFMST